MGYKLHIQKFHSDKRPDSEQLIIYDSNNFLSLLEIEHTTCDTEANTLVTALN